MPFIELSYVAEQLYGSKSRLHTRKLKDRLKGSFVFQSWEKQRLEELKQRMIERLCGQEEQVFWSLLSHLALLPLDLTVS